MTPPATLTILLESMPYPPERKSPRVTLPWRSGAFRVCNEIAGPIWVQVRESFNSFFVSAEEARSSRTPTVPGWRYTLEGLFILLEAGYCLSLGDTVLSTREALLTHLWSLQPAEPEAGIAVLVNG